MTQQPLSDWNDSTIKTALLDFLKDVTNTESEYYVKPADRIAVFDHDGTLWCEKPIMTQIEFIRGQFDENDTVKSDANTLVGKFIESVGAKVSDVFNDISGLTKEFLKGLSLEEYSEKVQAWLATAKHPRFNVPYTDLAYTPMLQVLHLLQQHGFQCFIVSGGTSAFIRPWCENVYNIATQNVIGSSLRSHVVERDGELVLEYLPVPFYFDNGDAKMRAIGRLIGKQPIVAFGNTGGDAEMLRYAGQAKRSFTALIHHTDAEREYKYEPDRSSLFGKKPLDMAKEYGWNVVDMKSDWKRVFDFD